MKPTPFKIKAILYWLIIITPFCVCAQPRMVAKIPNGSNSPHITPSNRLITIHREEDKNFLTETDITTGAQNQYLITNEADVYNCYFTTKGYFFFRGKYNSNAALVDTLCFFDFATKQMVRLRPINFRKNINDNTNSYRSLGVFNDLFYCVGANKDNTFDVWRSDGSVGGTRKIWTSNSPFPQVGYVNSFFLINSSNGSSTSIVSIADTGLVSASLLRLFDVKRFRVYFTNYGTHDGMFYINVFDTLTKDYQFVATKGTLQTTESRFRYPTTDYIYNQSFESTISAVGRDTLYVRSLQTGSILKKIPFPDENKVANGGRVYPIGNGLFETQSNKYGIELGYLNRNNSFINIDISKGPFSGLGPNSYWLRKNDVLYFNNATSDSFYLVGFTNNSNRKCLYKVILGPDSAKVFKLANLTYLDKKRIDEDKPFIANNKFYQMVYDIDLRDLFLYETTSENEAGIIEEPVNDSSLTWHRQVGFGALVTNDPQYVLSEINIDSKDNSILSVNILNDNVIANSWSGRNNVLKPFQQYDTRYAKNINALHLTFKISPIGNVIWTSSFGNDNFWVSNKLRQVIDNKDNVYVTGMAYQSAIFGTDTVKKQGAFLYLVKLDGNNGSIVYYKILAESQYTNDLDVDIIKVDQENNLFVSFHYKNFELPFSDVLVSNNWASPANALAKFDESGNLLWVKNTLTPFTRYFGQTRDMCFEDKSKKSYLIQSVGDYNWSSTCKFSEWDSYLQCLSLDGEVQWTKRIISDDLHSLRSIIIDNNGYINLSGYFRGTIQFDNYKLTSKPANGCNQFQYVTATLKPSNGETIMAMSFDNWVYLPHRNVATGIKDKNVSIGFEPVNSRNHTLMTKEIDQWGGITGYKKIEKLGSPFDFEFYPSIASRNNYVVVADIVFNSFDTFSNVMNNVYNVSVARYHLKDFFTPTDYNFPISNQHSTGNLYNLVIYPNPVNTELNVYSKNIKRNMLFTIYGVDGVKRLELKEEANLNISSFNVSELAGGVYFLQVEGDQGVEIYKFIKN